MLDEHRVPILRLLRHVLAELLELLLPDDAGIPEPATVGNDARAWQLLTLQVLLDELPFLVADGLLLVHQ